MSITAVDLRICELQRCGRVLTGMSLRARFCCESHRSEASRERSGRPVGKVPVGSWRPCPGCGRTESQTRFYSSGAGFRAIRCADCARTYMRDYLRRKNGVEVRRDACPQCGGDVHGRKRQFCSGECRRAASSARSADRRRAERVARECPVCKGSYVGRRRACGPRCESRISLVRKYGITYREYELLLEAQGFSCAACGSLFGDETPRIDHCHTSGRVRGLLHSNCNVGIGHAGDDPEKLVRWANYLRDVAA